MSAGDRSFELVEKTNDDAIQQHPDLSPETLAGLRSQEDQLIFTNISNEVLIRIGLDIVDMVEELPQSKKKPVVIDIEVNDRCIFRYAMSGTTRDNDWWIERKKRTVKHFERSSYYIGRSLHQSGQSWSTKYAGLPEADFAAHGGSFPIRTIVNGPVVGTITMSGLAQVLDHAVVTLITKRNLVEANS